jgi:hypothetical protein
MRRAQIASAPAGWDTTSMVVDPAALVPYLALPSMSVR